jgi:D-glycero-alpha-D-manno-heptose 1-phosphate guanylyltransferase
MIKEAVLLAGGLGTRLRSVIHELPKVMAPVNGKPFLHYLLIQLQKQGISDITLAVGYLKEHIMEWCDGRYPGMTIHYAVEDTPLGTGGAIAHALSSCQTEHVLLINGDTYFDLDYSSLHRFHIENGAICSLALKPMHDFDRYGSVAVDDQFRITSFLEKTYREYGLINAGVYVLQRQKFIAMNWPAVFSFEKDFLEKEVSTGRLSGFVSDGYFIDIGIPSDYAKVQHDFNIIFPG